MSGLYELVVLAWIVFWVAAAPVALVTVVAYEACRRSLGYCQCPPVDEAGHRLGCPKGLLEPERSGGR